ncbi:MAG: RNA polymerase sigma factor [Chloroflexi bacterium]|nr:RNA polymerase sigma factor [Chloroflexota bacterium]
MTVPENSSQRGLVERAQHGDGEAFARLVSNHLDASWRFVRAIGGDRVDPDDVVQEGFVMVWRDLPRLRNADAFEPWLRAVLVHATRHALRRDGGVRLIRITGDSSSDAMDRSAAIRADSLVDPHLEPGASLANRDAVAHAFGRLSVDQRTILALHYLEGHPLEWIAQVIRCPLGTVKSRLSGARSALRAALSAEDRPADD